VKFQVVFSVVVATVAVIVTWLVLAEGSPFASFFARHDSAADAWRMTVLLPFVFSAVISRNPHSPPAAIVMVGLFLQWLMVGYLLSIPVSKQWGRGQKK
jgi:hypothetical protein